MELHEPLIQPVFHPDIKNLHFFLAELREFLAVKLNKPEGSPWNYNFSKIDFSLLFCEMLEGLVNITKFFADHIEGVVDSLLPGDPILLPSLLRSVSGINRLEYDNPPWLLL